MYIDLICIPLNNSNFAGMAESMVGYFVHKTKYIHVHVA